MPVLQIFIAAAATVKLGIFDRDPDIEPNMLMQ